MTASASSRASSRRGVRWAPGRLWGRRLGGRRRRPGPRGGRGARRPSGPPGSEGCPPRWRPSCPPGCPGPRGGCRRPGGPGWGGPGARPPVDDGALDPAGGLVGYAGAVGPDDVGVHPHGPEGEEGVLVAFPLLEAARLGGEGDHVRRHAPGGELKGDPRPCGGLKEDRGHGEALEGGNLLYGPLQDLPHHPGGVQKALHLGPAPALEVQEVPHAPSLSQSSTRSSPSTSSTLTFTTSLREVGTFFPTKSARMGSSRCPRSTRTAR